MHRLELRGKKFGRLTVVGFAGINKRHFTLWECECECRNKCIVKGVNLQLGLTQSCGCLAHDYHVQQGKRIAQLNPLRAGTHRKDVAFRDLIRQYKQNARARNIAWEITDEDFRRLTGSPCYYSGLAPAHVFRTKSGDLYVYNGIDRVDSTKGYTLENCVPCNPAINKMKFELSQEQFIALCRLVARRFPARAENGSDESEQLKFLFGGQT
jgi:hypothetical protein